MNPALTWSVEFIARYIEYVCWELLSQNETVARNDAILYHFATDFEPFQDSIEMCRSEVKKDSVAEWEIERRAKYPELGTTHPDEHVLLDFPNWWLIPPLERPFVPPTSKYGVCWHNFMLHNIKTTSLFKVAFCDLKDLYSSCVIWNIYLSGNFQGFPHSGAFATRPGNLF